MLGSSAERLSDFENFVCKAGKTAVDGLFSPLSYGLELREDACTQTGRTINLAVPFILPCLAGISASRVMGLGFTESILAGAAAWWLEGLVISSVENFFCPPS